MALSIVLKHMMPQLPRKFASGHASEANENLKALLTLSGASRAMRADLHAAVDLGALRPKFERLRRDTEKLRLIRLESQLDAFLAGLEPYRHPGHRFHNHAIYQEIVDRHKMNAFKALFPGAKPSAAWFLKTFHSQYVQLILLEEYGHCPVECLENATMVVKPFDDMTLDDVPFDSYMHIHRYEGSVLYRFDPDDGKRFANHDHYIRQIDMEDEAARHDVQEMDLEDYLMNRLERDLSAHVNTLRACWREDLFHSIWDGYVDRLKPFEYGPDNYDSRALYLEFVDKHKLDYFQVRFPDAEPDAAWITRTFRSPYVQLMVLDKHGHYPVECFDDGRLAMKAFADLTLDDVLFDRREHAHCYDGSALCRETMVSSPFLYHNAKAASDELRDSVWTSDDDDIVAFVAELRAAM